MMNSQKNQFYDLMLLKALIQATKTQTQNQTQKKKTVKPKRNTLVIFSKTFGKTRRLNEKE